MKTKILFREEGDLASILAQPSPIRQEIQVAKKYFEVVESRSLLSNCNVIGRYSVLPYYRELEVDLAHNGAKLINSYQQHLYIARFEYYYDIEEYTPKTWFRLEDIRNEKGPFILKGVTNSRKHEWSKFFAKDFQQAVEVYCELKNDSLIGSQDIIIRQYEPLKNYGKSLTGIPFANEWRFFFYKGNMISYGFYWSGAENKPKKEDIDPQAVILAQKVADIVKDRTNGFVIDVAQKESGDWIVIELNDLQMSGLSDNDPEDFYKNLAKIISLEK